MKRAALNSETENYETEKLRLKSMTCGYRGWFEFGTLTISIARETRKTNTIILSVGCYDAFASAENGNFSSGRDNVAAGLAKTKMEIQINETLSDSK